MLISHQSFVQRLVADYLDSSRPFTQQDNAQLDALVSKVTSIVSYLFGRLLTCRSGVNSIPFSWCIQRALARARPCKIGIEEDRHQENHFPFRLLELFVAKQRAQDGNVAQPGEFPHQIGIDIVLQQPGDDDERSAVSRRNAEVFVFGSGHLRGKAHDRLGEARRVRTRNR